MISGGKKSAAFSLAFPPGGQSAESHNSTTGGDNFSALSGADDANMGLLYVRLQCIAMPGYMDYVVDIKLHVILLEQMSYAVWLLQ